MQKKASHDDCESDVSSNSPMRDPPGSSCINEMSAISDSSQSDLSRSRVSSFREHLHSRKLKPSKKPHKSRSARSKRSVAPQKSAVVMKHFICAPHGGSRSSQESHCQESNKPDSSVQSQHVECESSEKEKISCDPMHYLEEHEIVSSTPTHCLWHVSGLENVTKSIEVKETVSRVHAKHTGHVHKNSTSISANAVKDT